MLTGELTLEEAARDAVGNWQRFESFCWFRRNVVDDTDNWAIFYTHHRDSALLDQSNAAVIEKAMEPFTEDDDPDVVFESHNHWAVGHIDGFSIRVFKDGEITEAFKTYHELTERMAAYPVLDEDDYSQREFEATLENLTDQRGDSRTNTTCPRIGKVMCSTGSGNTTTVLLKTRTIRAGIPMKTN